MNLDLAALTDHLTRRDIELVGPLRAELISGGRSNLTYRLRDDVHDWVLRRPPLSGLTPSAHDMVREWRVTDALQLSDVPVAPTVLLGDDPDVLGAPFTITGYVAGQVIRSRSDLGRLTDAEVTAVADSLIHTLVQIHAIDPHEVGLGDFGRPEGFLARQVALWMRQWEKVATRELPDLIRLGTLLSERVPESGGGPAIVHGDFRIDNAILDSEDPARIRAIVDWELATVADPFTDVALMCIYRDPGFDPILGLPAAWASPRLPDPEELAALYQHKAGVEIPNWPFYLGLANLKLAVIAEGITHRARQGAAADETAAGAAEAVPGLVAKGLRALT